MHPRVLDLAFGVDLMFLLAASVVLANMFVFVLSRGLEATVVPVITLVTLMTWIDVPVATITMQKVGVDVTIVNVVVMVVVFLLGHDHAHDCPMKGSFFPWFNSHIYKYDDKYYYLPNLL